MIPEYIDLSKSPVKQTLGQQVIENAKKYQGQFTQDIRETTDEMGKQWNKELGDTIEKHKHIIGKYYINVILKKEIMFDNVLRALFVVRRTRPTPQWNSTLYSYDNASGTLLLEWVLPSANEAEFMLRAPEGWDPSLIKNIFDFAKGELS